MSHTILTGARRRRARRASTLRPFALALLLLVPAAPGRTAAARQQPGAVQKPAGTWQTPGPIQQPQGPWQTPGDIQVPKGIQAIHAQKSQCEERLTTVADALFDFDKATLNPDAEQTLSVLGPQIAQRGKHPVTVEGHTDSIGTDAHNQALSERRAATVRDWLAAHGYVPASTPIRGYGKKRPVAPNTRPDGRDDPAGRQKNRRVEVVIQTCA
jgi:outer membrane protein OmpA-like peptidoglycan-associated protein